jgi:hypothetical protein
MGRRDHDAALQLSLERRLRTCRRLAHVAQDDLRVGRGELRPAQGAWLGELHDSRVESRLVIH